MADLAVSSALALRRRSDGTTLVLDRALEIGVGGEARVLGVPGDDTLVAKLYHEPTLERARKLARMIEAPPALVGASLAWPIDLLTDPSGGRLAGFLMKRAEGPRVFELYNPVSRRRAAPLFDWAMLHRAGASLAAAFDALHGAGYVVGDVNESNILVSPHDASVTLVDADSMQVRDAAGIIYRSKVGKAEFTPPELQGTHFGEVDRAPEHDRFGLAALLFLLVMEGTHPFAQRFEGDAEALPVEERIRRGLYPHARAFDGCKPPRMAPPIQTLHPGLQALFLRCFAHGHADPSARPTAAEWRDALTLAEAELRACDENPRHRFGAHIPFCPWCHRARLLQGRDPFPASVELARAAEPAPVRPRRAPDDAPARTWPQPPAARPAASPALPLTTALAQQPSQLSVFLAGVQSALPAWLAGPSALGGPLPWAAPALLTVLFGGTGGLRMAAMAVGYLVLRRIFRGGLPRFTVLTVMWIVLLLTAWSVVAGIAGSSADSNVSILRTLPPTSFPPAPVPADGYSLADVDIAPSILDPDGVEEAIAKAYPPLLRDAGVTGTADVTFLVDVHGRVDPASVEVVSATHELFGQAAREVVEKMRFRPGTENGLQVDVRMGMPIVFSLPTISPN